jgi:O-methyltransferase
MNPTELYLNLLKKSLINELYLEVELRILYIFSMLASGRPVDADIVREFPSRMGDWVKNARGRLEVGSPEWNTKVQMPDGSVRELNLRNVSQFSHSMVGRARLDNVQFCLDRIREEGIQGDLCEAGVWRGGVTIFMRGYLAAHEMTDRLVWAADSFEGLPVPSLPQDEGYDLSKSKSPVLAVSLEEVQNTFRLYDLLDDRVRFLKGWFRDTLAPAPIEKLALLRLDGDLYESTMDTLDALYDRVVVGGYVIVDDYGGWESCKLAVDEFREKHGINDQIQRVDWTGAYWRKTS